ncbi:MAG: DsrE family protein [Gemmatimonadaceae bacterium]
MRITTMAAALLALTTAPLMAQQAGPIINSGGGFTPIVNPTFEVPKDLTYRVSWDILAGSSKPSEANAAFDGPARFINQSVGNGIPRANMQLAIVVHGTAGEELLGNAEYRVRKGSDNPNVAILEEMSKAGVRIIICGQTMAGRKMTRDQLLPFVQVAPSATWAHAVLQTQGFKVNPW